MKIEIKKHFFIFPLHPNTKKVEFLIKDNEENMSINSFVRDLLEIIDPLSGRIFRDAVITSVNRTYEQNILSKLIFNGEGPYLRGPEIRVNSDIQSKILLFLVSNPEFIICRYTDFSCSITDILSRYNTLEESNNRGMKRIDLILKELVEILLEVIEDQSMMAIIEKNYEKMLRMIQTINKLLAALKFTFLTIGPWDVPLKELNENIELAEEIIAKTAHILNNIESNDRSLFRQFQKILREMRRCLKVFPLVEAIIREFISTYELQATSMNLPKIMGDIHCELMEQSVSRIIKDTEFEIEAELNAESELRKTIHNLIRIQDDASNASKVISNIFANEKSVIKSHFCMP